MQVKNEKIIGVIGGMGPYAGLDLVDKIFDQTDAHSDQEHLPVALLSYPGRIIDRSAFLSGNEPMNPGDAIAEIALQLDRLGAVVAAMPCNTAHAPPIFDRIIERLEEAGASLEFLNMIDETVRFIRQEQPDIRRVGVLSTMATYEQGLYSKRLKAAGLEAVLLDEQAHEALANQTIFSPEFGIKSFSNPPTERARENLLKAIALLKQQGAEMVIMGCTELPLAVPEAEVDGVPLIDPAAILARALILRTHPERLRGKTAGTVAA
jgi:aspartate racemase